MGPARTEQARGGPPDRVRRTPPLKTAFNLALGLAETCIAVALFSLLSAGSDSPGPMTWVAAYAAALAANTVGGLAIAWVIAQHEGSMHLPRMMRDAVLQP